mgnify:CR=1 FL=1
MKVELLVTLKCSGNKLLGKGIIFTDPLPQEVKNEIKLNRGTVRIIEDSTPVESSNPVKSLTKRNK